MSTFAKRLDVHFAALAAVGVVAGVGTAQHADAAIVASGPVNIPIPLTTAGVYLNIVTGVNNASPSLVPGWDINPYGSTSLILFNPGAPAGGVYASVGGNFDLTLGTLVDSTSTYGSGTMSTLNFNSDNNYIGFRFQNEAAANQVQYAWAQLHIGASATDPARAIIAYAYENSGAGILVGAVPAPSAGMAALALGGIGLLGRRRK